LKKKFYDKLVRDNIIDIIKKDGKDCRYEVVKGEKYKKYLKRKLLEEVNELLADENSTEEYIDILEVLAVYQDIFDIDPNFRRLFFKKQEEKGSFRLGLILKEVREFDSKREAKFYEAK
jgi:predicted house-cleaning noncanonical NTP pyrophosphatase (MazG superfamily)